MIQWLYEWVDRFDDVTLKHRWYWVCRLGTWLGEKAGDYE